MHTRKHVPRMTELAMQRKAIANNCCLEKPMACHKSVAIWQHTIVVFAIVYTHAHIRTPEAVSVVYINYPTVSAVTYIK